MRICSAALKYLFTSLAFATAISMGALADARICTESASQISEETGVPRDVLMAISLTETGRASSSTTEPWPWTVNMEGKGVWFSTRDEALAYVYRHHKRGARSFDIGCFQINFKWHGQNFDSIAHMFEPVSNARYAADFLSDLHRELGDWSKAAGAYHSRTEKFAKKYRKKFDQFRIALGHTSGPSIPSDTSIVPANRYPLLQVGGRRAIGSLVPLDMVGKPLVELVRQ